MSAARRLVPGYWMNETSGELRPVIERYLTAQHLTARDVAIMRVYLRQWINDGAWIGPLIDALRTQVDESMTGTGSDGGSTARSMPGSTRCDHDGRGGGTMGGDEIHD
jgi:hypothetical protein